MTENHSNSEFKISTPSAVIVGALIIAGAILISRTPGAGSDIQANKQVAPSEKIEIAPITEQDHITGGVNPDIILVEFSDIECPFCKVYHETMNKVVKDYNGKVAWVYRHFPLDNIHPKARKEAVATECAAELGGNDKFWEYLNKVIEITPSNNGLDLALLPKIATDIGLDKSKFETCLNSGKYDAKIESQYQDGIKTGVKGTPHTIVITKDGKMEALTGAQPYSTVKATIDRMLKK